jgi:hypothetical protein
MPIISFDLAIRWERMTPKAHCDTRKWRRTTMERPHDRPRGHQKRQTRGSEGVKGYHSRPYASHPSFTASSGRFDIIATALQIL